MYKNNFTILEKKTMGNVDQIKVRQIFQECDTINNNKRVYPKEQIETGIKQIKGKLENRQLMGELDHPESNDVNRIQYIKLTEVSHLITDLRIEGNKVIGEFETLNTPNGVILRNLIEHGVTLGVSLRQLGSIEEKLYEGESVYYVVPDDFELITYDVVSEPGFSSQTFNVLKESQQEILDSKLYGDKFEKFVYERLYYHMKKKLQKF